MSSYIQPTADIFVIYLLGSEKNKDLLLDFINAVLADSDFPRVCEIDIKNPFNIKRFIVDKKSILDVRAKDEAGRIYNIEIQSIGNETYINRALYYWSKNYSDQLEESELYEELKPVISINLLNFKLIDTIDKLHTCFMAIEKDNPEYAITDHFQLHFIELKKYHQDKLDNIDKHLRDCIEYFIFEGKEEDRMQVILRDNKVIKKAHDEYKRFTEDDEYRSLYDARIKFQRDYQSNLVHAEKKGREEGREEGEILDKQKILIRFLEKKFRKLRQQEVELIKSVTSPDILDAALDAILQAESITDVLAYFKG